MGRPAARVTDMTVCPMVTGLVPHVGGPIAPPCQVNVIVGGMPQARVTDKTICAAGGPSPIVTGSATVLVGGKPAARIGDMHAHGGTIITGFPTVLIGDAGGGGGVFGSGLSASHPSDDVVDKELLLDVSQIVLDIIGILDPTGVADLTSGAISLSRGDYIGALISTASLVPYLGDLAKAGKIPAFTRTVSKAVKLLEKAPNSATAEAITPVLKQLRSKLGALNVDKLPERISKPIRKLQAELAGSTKLLNKKERLEKGRKIIEQGDFSTQANRSVFYSGPGSRDAAIKSGLDPIDATIGGKDLNKLDLYDELAQSEADEVWSAASKKFAQEARGDVVAYVKTAKPERVFGSTELPELLKNKNVTSINGIAREKLASMSQQEAFEAVVRGAP